MKAIIVTAILICSIMAPRFARGEGTNTLTVTTNKVALIPIIVLTAALAGAAYVVYAYEKNNKNSVIPILILQRSPDHHSWQNIWTNYNVQLNGTNKIEIFRCQIDADPQRDSSFYRVVIP